MSKNSIRDQPFPPSFVTQTPSPGAALPRISLSPPPDQTMSGFEALTATAPTVPPKYASVLGAQVIPPSVVLKRPLPVVPIQYSPGRLTEPATATDRPPRNGPISRHFNPAKALESKV